MTVRNQVREFSATGPLLPGTGAAGFYTQHTKSDFLEVGYAVAPPPIQAALAAEIEFLRRTLRGSGNALELGCGHGRLLEALRDSARHWVGLDFIEAFARQAHRRECLRGRAGLTTGDMAQLPFAGSVFDVVLCAQSTLGLMGDNKAMALREAARVLRPGGRMVVVVYSEFSVVPRVRWYVELHRRGHMAPLDWPRCTPGLLVTEDGHRSECFRQDQLERLFGDVGLAPRLQRLTEIYWVVEAQRPRD